jgi:hypothetical protein
VARRPPGAINLGIGQSNTGKSNILRFADASAHEEAGP